ncbi:hypothetical protein T10_6869 [Trichinella papuae]|uniref:Uncharacterized protein n=1 Tax=Trichinella papuae TaxID=268474 RepID=A0A0V1MD18_9BILA|nr:hypothetical protein T10_6869 [Trichinella papuae]
MLPGTSFTGNSPVVVEIIASKVGIACVITLEAELFFTHISGNKQLGASLTGNSPLVVEITASKVVILPILIHQKITHQ